MSGRILGTVRFDNGLRMTAAVLHSDGQWTTPDAWLTEGLNAIYHLRDYSPADGRRGARQLHMVARLLRGTVEMPAALSEPEPGTVY